MTKHPCNVHKVARNAGVKIKSIAEHGSDIKRYRECFCQPTLKEIGVNHGEDHLRFVLMLICGSKANAHYLFADVIKSVSKIIVARPDLIKRPSFMDDFNKMDIGAMRSYARLSPIGLPVSSVLMVMMLAQLCDETKRVLGNEMATD